MRPADFLAQLRALRRAGWPTITAAEVAQHLRDREPLPPRSFAITIDDGARDGFTHAGPILRSLGTRATFCVTPGRVGRNWQLTWPMLRAIQSDGHEIANHTLPRLAVTTAWGATIDRASPFLAPRVRVHASDSPRPLVARLERLAARQAPATRSVWQPVRWSVVPAPRPS